LSFFYFGEVWLRRFLIRYYFIFLWTVVAWRQHRKYPT